MYSTAAKLARDLAAGRADPVALTEETFAQIEGCGDDAIFIDLLRPRAMAEAEAARARLKAGAPAGPLDGVPVAWKDLFDLEGRVTTAGSVVLGNSPPADRDAATVRAGADAGMISVGTLNMTEFAYSGIGLNPHYGTPRNPHAPGEARVPGGSSSGCGVAVARGLVPLSFGTDTGGSVRIPASLNGVVGYKSSTGRYPMDGVFPLSRSLDTIGPLAGDVTDCVLADAALRGIATDTPRAMPLADITLLAPETLVLDDCEDAVAAAFEETLSRLSAAGARIERAPLPELAEIPALVARRGHVQAAEALAVHWDRVHGPEAAEMDARVVRRIRSVEDMSAVDLIEFERARRELIATSTARIGPRFVVCPATPTVAMPVAPLERDQDTFFAANARTLRNTMLGNFLDWCGVSIPNGQDGDGMPTGFLVSATHGRDEAVLAAALAMETAIRG